MPQPPIIDHSPNSTLELLLEQAHSSFTNGQDVKTAEICNSILEIQPNHPESHYLLGLLAIRGNHADASLAHFEAAIDQNPEYGPYWLAYIDALDQAGQTDAACQTLAMAQQAGLTGREVDTLTARLNAKISQKFISKPEDNNDLLSLYTQGNFSACEQLALHLLENFPKNGFTWKILGATLQQQNRPQEAIFAMQQAVLLLPSDPDAHNNLGITLKNTGDLKGSETSLRQAITLRAGFSEAHNNLGVTLMAQGRLTESEKFLRQALVLQPDYAEAHCNLGINLRDQGRLTESAASFQKALQLNPSSAEAYNNFGNLLQGQGRLSDAESHLHKALDLKPDLAVAWNNLANTLHCQGRLTESQSCYEKALALKPDYAEAFDGLLFASNYHPDASIDDIFQLYCEYDKQFGLPLRSQWQPHINSHNTQRRLKIGYVSPAFYSHPVFLFLEPLLAHHDKSKFEIFAYSETIREDQATLSCKQHTDHWIPTSGLSDDTLAQQIRDDGIDILIDLAGHTGRNRLGVFARKPAPVSLHWLDFGYTTGLSAIDYYLTDIHNAPMGSEHLFSEQLWRLPAPAIAYRPAAGMGEVSSLPALNRKYVTFGTLTRAIRINHRTIRVWSEILHRVKGSQLIIDSGNFKDQKIQEDLKARFASHGIDSNRLLIGYHSPPWDVLRDMDICLDCFPHNSGTTLLESLYLGVPFITLADRPAIGRLGCTVLEGAGHPEWIALNEEEYIEKVVTLASDLPGLAAIRSNLRSELQKSPLMDEQGFTKIFEDAYQQMFQQWSTTSSSAISQTKDNALTTTEKISATKDTAIRYYNLGVQHQIANRLSEAKKAYIQAINLHSTFTEASNNLGVIFQQEGKFDDAAACFLRTLALNPDYADAWYNLGNTYKLKHILLKAEEAYRKTLQLKPDHINALYNLGNNLQEQGRQEEAETCLRHVLVLDPNNIDAYSTLLYTLNYDPDKSQEEIFQAYEDANSRFFLPHHTAWQPHTNSPLKNRRLRVGYVAPDYRKHPSRYFLRPLLAHHDKSLLEIYAYVQLSEDEAKNDLFYSFVDHWVPTQAMTDEQLSERIRSDAIDVLIDLAGHTAHNRLGVFARKPAPVSLHWLDFGYTTGLTAIDYYLTDHISVPDGSKKFFSEKPWYLTTPALAYRPPEQTGDINALPALTNGFVTFGTLTRAVRINHRTILRWAEILKKCPDSRLIINSGSYSEPAMQEILAARFLEHGIERQRLDIGYTSPPWDVLRKMDIGLDCFPHNSGTTLIESLYMGVPYITLADRPSVGRLGSSILKGIGHPEWIATNEDLYILKAVSLAADLLKLSEIRTNLRQDMKKSPLMDEQGFAGKVENAYQEMFRLWCDAQPKTTVKDHKSKKDTSTRQLDKNVSQKKRAKEIESLTPSNIEINKLIELFNQGNLNDATPLARSLTTRFPHYGFGWKVLGPLLHQQGLYEEAGQAMLQATICLPDDPDTHFNLGISRERSGLLTEAANSYGRTLEISRNHTQALYNLGNILKGKGQLTEAENCYRRIIEIKPDIFEVHCNLGNILRAQGKLSESVNTFQTALQIRPDSAEALNNLGLALRTQGSLTKAEDICKQALILNPDLPEANNNLGLIYQDQGKLTEAAACYQLALAIKPDYAVAYQNLGNTCVKQGKLLDAENFLRKAIALQPESPSTYSDLFFLLNNHPDKSSEEIYEEYRIFDSIFGIPRQTEWKPFSNNHKTKRRLKIGYVSSNFSKHSTRHFLEPLLAHHHKKAFEIYAYTDQINEDEVTDRYKSYVDHWVKCTGINDVALTERIRSDNIDILIDLAGHTGGNRLGVFARKPAPVSLHWLDFGYTTGLTAIDYYLTDETTVPKGSEHLLSETPWRIKTPCLVYRPAEGMGEVSPLPALERGYVTFGTLTRSLRINHRTISVWSAILKRVEGSHLIIDSSDFKDKSSQDELISKFITHGIAREQLEIGFHSPPWDVIRGIDVGFDCFPHNSGTTLLENLYLGIPFITLADRPCTGRLGSAILEGIGHPEWIAHTELEYIEHAVALASDLTQLSALRANLRTELSNSPLMDEPAFTCKVEAAYKEMFALWSSSEQSSTQDTNQKTASAQLHTTSHKIAKPHPDEIKKILSLFNQGNFAATAILARSLIQRFPKDGFSWKVLGAALQQQGKLDEALSVMQQASPLLLYDADYHNNYAIILFGKGQYGEAESETRAALKLNPGLAEAYLNLGDILQHKEQYSEAESNYRQAITLKPDCSRAYCNLAKTLIKQGRPTEAVDCCKKAIQIHPSFAEAYNCAGLALNDKGLPSEAYSYYLKAIEYNPHYAEAYNNLGISQLKNGGYSEAEAYFRKALLLKPDYAEAYNNFGNLLKEQGRLEESEANYRQAIKLLPDSPGLYSNLLFLLNNYPDKTAKDIYAEYKQFNKLFGIPLQTEWKPFTNNRQANRRLKVGYISSTLGKHSTQHFLEPLLASHDKAQVEIYIYTDFFAEVEATRRYIAYADHWLQTSSLNDAALSERIRTDGIDILVDISGHTGGNRLGVFARKPAPVSLHWLDFGYTTGLTAIDYYLTDPTNVPEGFEGLFAETPWRVKTPCLVYRPAEGMGEVGSLPALRKNYITFGTLTRALRINHRTIRVWSEILNRVQGAHLIVNSSNYKDITTQHALTEKFIAQGVNREQLEIGFTSPPWDLMRDMDIGLDCFPHNSGTTLIETLYMGSPFITLADRPSVGRLGSSILESTGHPEWIAQTEEDYIEKAVALAGDLPKLATLRAGLRQEMKQSPLMDEPAFARKVETAYRKMFTKWCTDGKHTPAPASALPVPSKKLP